MSDCSDTHLMVVLRENIGRGRRVSPQDIIMMFVRVSVSVSVSVFSVRMETGESTRVSHDHITHKRSPAL